MMMMNWISAKQEKLVQGRVDDDSDLEILDIDEEALGLDSDALRDLPSDTLITTQDDDDDDDDIELEDWDSLPPLDSETSQTIAVENSAARPDAPATTSIGDIIDDREKNFADALEFNPETITELKESLDDKQPEVSIEEPSDSDMIDDQLSEQIIDLDDSELQQVAEIDLEVDELEQSLVDNEALDVTADAFPEQELAELDPEMLEQPIEGEEFELEQSVDELSELEIDTLEQSIDDLPIEDDQAVLEEEIDELSAEELAELDTEMLDQPIDDLAIDGDYSELAAVADPSSDVPIADAPTLAAAPQQPSTSVSARWAWPPLLTKKLLPQLTLDDMQQTAAGWAHSCRKWLVCIYAR